MSTRQFARLLFLASIAGCSAGTASYQPVVPATTWPDPAPLFTAWAPPGGFAFLSVGDVVLYRDGRLRRPVFLTVSPLEKDQWQASGGTDWVDISSATPLACGGPGCKVHVRPRYGISWADVQTDSDLEFDSK